MNKNIILSVIGPDKPGIVSNISEIVKDCSGNIDKSRMVRLGNFFTVMVLISIDENHLPNLENKLNTDSKYTVSIHESKSDLNNIDENIYTVHLDGIDNEGLVYKITNELAKLNINIEELETNISNAPMSGLTLFSLIAKISHSKLDHKVLNEKMDELANELDVNIILKD